MLGLAYSLGSGFLLQTQNTPMVVGANRRMAAGPKDSDIAPVINMPIAATPIAANTFIELLLCALLVDWLTGLLGYWVTVRFACRVL